VSKRAATGIIIALFIPLGILIVVYAIRLHPALNRLFTPKTILDEQHLIAQMKSFQSPDGSILDIKTGIGGSDERFGGRMLQGVLTGVSRDPLPILTKEGKEIAKSIVTLEVKYFDANGALQSIQISPAIQLADGTYYFIDTVPFQIDTPNVRPGYYESRLGTLVVGLFRAQLDKVLEVIKNTPDFTPKQYEQAEKVFSFINEYETSWSQELDQFILGTGSKNMQFLFPIVYTQHSFDPEYAQFTLSAKN